MAVLDNIHRLAIYLKPDDSETGICLQFEPTQLGTTESCLCCCWCSKTEITSIYWTLLVLIVIKFWVTQDFNKKIYWIQLSRLQLKTEIESRIRNIQF
jgi:hypothetical protein